MNTIVRAIVELINNSVDTPGSPLAWIKKVYHWDPRKIALSSFPAIVVKWIESDYRIRGTATNTKVYRVDIILVVNAKDYYKDVDNDVEKVEAVEAWHNMVNKTSSDHSTIPETIVWIIESQPRLPYTNDSEQTAYACLFASVEKTREMLRKDRKFHTYEITTTIKATVVADNA